MFRLEPTCVPEGVHLRKRLLIPVSVALGALAFGWISPSWVHAGDKQAATPKAIAQAISELADKRFPVREKATVFLWKAGLPAERALQAALRDPAQDLEASQRMQKVLNKFRWGIFADTPKQVLELIDQYKGQTGEAKGKVLQELLERGPSAYPVVARLVRVIDSSERGTAWAPVAAKIAQMAPRLLEEGKLDQLESLLELGVSVDHETTRRDYLALLLLRGRLDLKIAQWRPEADHAGGEWAVPLLAAIYRAKGDVFGQRWAAEKSGKPAARLAVLQAEGSWKELAGLADELAGNADQAGLRAAYQRLAGRTIEFEKTIAHIAVPGPEEAGAFSWQAKALFFNRKAQLGLEALTRDHHYNAVFEILAAQGRYREALKVAEQKTTIDTQVLEVDLDRRVALLHFLGEREQALALIDKVTKSAKAEADPAKQAALQMALLKSEMKLNLWSRASARAAPLLAQSDKKIPDPTSGEEDVSFEPEVDPVLSVLFPKSQAAAGELLQILQPMSPAPDRVKVLDRLKAVLEGKLPATDLSELIKRCRKMAEADKRESLWAVLPGICRKHQRDDLARECLVQWTALHGSAAAWAALGDFQATKKQWAEAAVSYERAWSKAPDQALLCYRRGRALIKAGQAEQGKKWTELARWLPLGDASRRLKLVEEQEKAGEEEQLVSNCAIMVKLGSDVDLDFATDAALGVLAFKRAQRKDFLGAATMMERTQFTTLRPTIFYLQHGAYVTMPSAVCVLRARGLLAAGKVDAARSEFSACLACQPNNINLPIHVVPELTRLGKAKEADAMFAKFFAANADLCREFPKSAQLHNQLAWLAVCCRRDLDKALVHAEIAVALAPVDPAPIDTLAEVHFQLGRKDQALRFIEQALKLAPERAYFLQQKKRFEAGDPKAPIPEH